MRILVVEDEPKTGDYLKQGLAEAGFVVDLARDGLDGLHLALTEAYDLAVLDVMLPGADGWEILQGLRKAGKDTPVLFLTARDSVDDRVKGLELGADDYLVKPFAFAELLARIEALTRRFGRDDRLVVGTVALDPVSRRVTSGDRTIELTAKEFDLLECLMRHRGRVLTREELKDYVWDFSFDAKTKVVDLYVHYLRRKLGDDDIIETVRGVGYVVGR